MANPMGDIGPADFIFNSLTLGSTHGANFRYQETTADHLTAQTGASAKDKIITGQVTQVEIAMTESTIAQLGAVANNGTVDGDELMLANGVGTSLRASAAQLIVKPYVNGAATADETKWLTVFEAAPEVNWDVVFDAEGDREYSVVFHCFPADDVPSGETYAIGDISAFGYGQGA